MFFWCYAPNICVMLPILVLSHTSVMHLMCTMIDRVIDLIFQFLCVELVQERYLNDQCHDTMYNHSVEYNKYIILSAKLGVHGIY